MSRLSNKLKNYTTLLFMISATLIGKVLGMAREMFLAYHYGSGPEAIAFMTASRLPLNFFDLALGAAIGSAFIPTFNEIRMRRGESDGLKFANQFVNLMALAATGVTALGVSFAPFFVRIIAGGLEAGSYTYSLTVSLTRMMFPMLIFTAMAFTFVGILQSYGEFNIPAAISILSNLVMILYFILFNDRFGVEGMAIAMIIGWFLQMFIQLPVLRKKGYRYRPTLVFAKKDMMKVGTLMLPILISTWAQPINVMINTYLALFIDGGSAMAILEYANKVFIIIAGVIILAITNISFPSMSQFIVDEDTNGFAGIVQQALRMIIFFMTPITVGVCIFSPLIVQVLYERGDFTSADSAATSQALIFYALGIVFYGVRELLSKAFYSAKDTKTPMRVAFIGISFNIGMSIVLAQTMEANGLALAASLSALLMAVMLLSQFDRKIHKLVSGQEAAYAIKALVGSLIMGMAVYLVFDKLTGMVSDSTIMNLLMALAATAVGVGIYFGWSLLVGMQLPHLKLHREKKNDTV